MSLHPRLASLLLFIALGSASAAAPAPKIDEPLKSGTSGEQVFDRSTFTGEGWRVTSKRSALRWDLGSLFRRGVAEFELRGNLEQEEKRIIFAARNTKNAPAQGEDMNRTFLQLRLVDEGAMLRYTNRAKKPPHVEKHTGPIKWGPPDAWVHFKVSWDTKGGTTRVYLNGKEIRNATFANTSEGFRWITLGMDTYGEYGDGGYESVPGFTFRNLRVHSLEP